MPTGFVFVDELLKLRQFKSCWWEWQEEVCPDRDLIQWQIGCKSEQIKDTPSRLAFLHCKRLGMLTFRKEISLDNHDARFQFYVILLGLTIWQFNIKQPSDENSYKCLLII